MIIDVTDKLEDTKLLLKTRIYTDFCDRCNYRKDLTGCCDYIEQSAIWDCVMKNKDIEQVVNEFTCPYNIERLTLTKGNNEICNL